MAPAVAMTTVIMAMVTAMPASELRFYFVFQFDRDLLDAICHAAYDFRGHRPDPIRERHDDTPDHRDPTDEECARRDPGITEHLQKPRASTANRSSSCSLMMR